MNNDIEKILFTREQLSDMVSRLADRINEDYKGEKLLVVGILKGACVFMTDLMRDLTVDCSIDFMAVSSYGSGVESSGTVRIRKDLDVPIEGRNVLIVEDILDSGTTLGSLFKLLKTRNPKSLRLCVLLDKPERRVTQVKCDYVGFSIPDAFIVGYGLDYDEKYRNLPYIGVLKKEIYEK